jgi:hypothetical protein
MGAPELEVKANNPRPILERRFPGLGHQVDESMAVLIRTPVWLGSSPRARSTRPKIGGN